MSDKTESTISAPTASAAPVAPVFVPPSLDDWQVRIGKRTLIRHFKREDDIFECVPIDTAAPNLVRMLLVGGHKEWRDGSKFILVADLKGGVIDELQIAHADEKQKLVANIEALQAKTRESEAAAGDLQRQIDDLTAQLTAANNQIKALAEEREQMIEKLAATTAKRINDAKARFDGERDAHQQTIEQLSRRLAERDEAIVTLERENARHVGDKAELAADLDRARRDLIERDAKPAAEPAVTPPADVPDSQPSRAESR